MSTSTLENIHEKIERICELIQTIEPVVEILKERPANGQAWYDTLQNKLCAQTAADSPLILAVAGGTNIGKSTIFNHLAQDDASGVCPMASGTKYPVCLVPPVWADQSKLDNLFQGNGSGFEAIPWTDSRQPLLEYDHDVLFWREERNLPNQLILLDTPDIDSNNQGNWRRAEKVRQMADLIIAVLTQQKYNDLACSQFFAEAANSGKQFLVVFNQVDLDESADYWPQWIETFVNQVGQAPLLTYVCPHDRILSKELRLPFYELDANQNYQIISSPEYGLETGRDNAGGRNFQTALASLHFNRLKYNSLKGALSSALSSESGLQKWLNDLETQSERFAIRRSRFSSNSLEGFQPTPLPTKLVVQEFRRWRNNNLPTWGKRVLETYDFAATKIIDLAKKGVQLIQRTPETVPEKSLEDQLMQKEREQMIGMVSKIFDQLELESKNDDLTGDQLNRILGGANRVAVLNKIREEYENMVPIDKDFQVFIVNQLDEILSRKPSLQVLKVFGSLLGAARLTVTGGMAFIAFTAFGPLAIPVSVVIDIALGKPVSDTIMNKMVRFLERIQKEYCRNRFSWLVNLIYQEMLKDYVDNLQACADFKDRPDFLELRDICQKLEAIPQ